MELREAWLATVEEEILEPGRPILDPHFHFFEDDPDFPVYRLADLQRDTSRHNVTGAIYMECQQGYRDEGPAHLRPVGESVRVKARAQEAAASPDRVQLVAMIGEAELVNGAEAVAETLDAHLEASPLFRGVRDMGIWDASAEIARVDYATDLDWYGTPVFRAGFAEVAKRGLVFDGYQYHTQLPSLTALARAFPETTIVVDHLGAPLHVGPYAGRTEEVFLDWRQKLSDIAACPNVVIKLGGMAMPWSGFGWAARERPPTSDEFVETYARYYDHAIQVFGPNRCMFESNFPVDKMSLSYDVLWNGFKKLAAGYSEDEKDALFRGTAQRVYRVKETG